MFTTLLWQAVFTCGFSVSRVNVNERNLGIRQNNSVWTTGSLGSLLNELTFLFPLTIIKVPTFSSWYLGPQVNKGRAGEHSIHQWTPAPQSTECVKPACLQPTVLNYTMTWCRTFKIRFLNFERFLLKTIFHIIFSFVNEKSRTLKISLVSL